MSLIANLFPPARTLKPSTHTLPASSTSDNPPSFNDALDSALQPQRSPAPPSPSAAKPESKPQRTEKKTDRVDDASDDQPSAADDSTTADASTTQTSSAPAQSGQSTLSKKTAAKDDQDSDAQSVDPNAQQIAAAAFVQTQTQPLPLAQSVSLATVQTGAVVNGQPVPAASLASQKSDQQPAKPTAPAPQAGAAQDPTKDPTSAALAETSDASGPLIKSTLKRAIDSPRTAAPAKSTDRSATTADAETTPDTPTAETPAATPPAPSPFASHANPKFTTSTAQTAQSQDAPASQTSTPTPGQAQATTPDATVIAQSIKSLASAPTTDDSAPAPLQSSTTPMHTLAAGSNHPIDNSATPAAPAQDSHRAESDQTFDQIVLGLRTKMDATHSRAEISLNPPNLGTLHVSVSLQNGSLTAQFQSSSEVVRDLLKGNMEKLKSVLESQGVTVDNLAVGAPQDKTELPSAAPAAAQTNQSANDGRSAGQYNQDSQNRKRSQDSGAFAKTWQHANAKAPIDLVA